MFEALINRIINSLSDEMVHKLTKEPYDNNLFESLTVAQRLGVRSIIEATLRAQSPTPITRPLGSPINHSQWESIYLSGRQLFQLPTANTKEINMKVTIGPFSKRPFQLSMPVMITAMSYGGSLSLKAKQALAKGAALAGISTNTGESAVAEEERNEALYLIGQLNRSHRMTDEDLKKVDAIEVQLGQGAYGGASTSTKQAFHIDEHLRKTWRVGKTEDVVFSSRLKGVNSPEEVIGLLNGLKEKYDVPIGIKIAASHHIEKDLDVIIESNADYIVIDGAEGGTAVAPAMMQDHIGLPTIFGLSRTVRYLEERGVRHRFQVIAAGGMKDPGVFLKALALGADAVYIGTIALMALASAQVEKALPFSPPPQLLIHGGKLTDQLDVDQGAEQLKNFLLSCMEEMKLALLVMGKKDVKELSRDDLTAVTKELADALDIGYAGQLSSGLPKRPEEHMPTPFPVHDDGAAFNDQPPLQ